MKNNKQEIINIPLEFEGKEFFMVKYEDNWADEMNIEGFMVMNSQELENWKSRIPKKYRFNLGTNEEIEYDSKKEFLNTIKINSISVEEARFLYGHFGSDYTDCLEWNGREFNKMVKRRICEFGFFPSLHDDEIEDLDEDDSIDYV